MEKSFRTTTQIDTEIHDVIKSHPDGYMTMVSLLKNKRGRKRNLSALSLTEREKLLTDIKEKLGYETS